MSQSTMLQSCRYRANSSWVLPVLCFAQGHITVTPVGIEPRTSPFTPQPSEVNSEIDNNAYCVCTHDFSLFTHKKFRPVCTMYAVKISGKLTVFGFMRTQIEIPLKLSQNDIFSAALSTIEK